MSNKTDNSPKKIRYRLIDELRGFLVLCMVFYHGFFTFSTLGYKAAGMLFDFFTPAEPYFASGFILVSGCMCHFSRSNLKRGAILLLISLGVTGVTYALSPFVGEITIYFGILHLLSVCMLLAGLLGGALKKVPSAVGILLCAGLFFATYGIAYPNEIPGLAVFLPNRWYDFNFLFPLGIYGPGFYSADYFPLLPWMFMFFIGYYLGKLGFIQKNPEIFMPGRIAPLAFLGRHALAVYILHQPLIYGAAWIITKTFG